MSRFPFLKPTQGGVLLELHIAPRSSRSRIAGIHGSRLKVALSAPPVDGKANQALIEFIAGEMGLARSLISLERGQTSREKTLRIQSDINLIEQKLAQIIP